MPWPNVVKRSLKTYAANLSQEAITDTKEMTEDYQADILDPVVLQVLNNGGASDRPLDCVGCFWCLFWSHNNHFFLFELLRARGFDIMDFHPDTMIARFRSIAVGGVGTPSRSTASTTTDIWPHKTAKNNAGSGRH